jgi:hypothetical protein
MVQSFTFENWTNSTGKSVIQDMSFPMRSSKALNTITGNHLLKVKKVKQSRYRPGVAQMFPGS